MWLGILVLLLLQTGLLIQTGLATLQPLPISTADETNVVNLSETLQNQQNQTKITLTPFDNSGIKEQFMEILNEMMQK